MSLTFHVFAKDNFVQSVTNQGNNGTTCIQDYCDSVRNTTTLYYSLRRGSRRPDLDGWFILRSLSRLNDEDVPPVIRTLALMMDL